MKKTKNALISVYDKTKLSILVKYLESNNYKICSTGGTMKEILKLVNNKECVISVSNYTNSPEICNGRVKTLHPLIFGGILGLRDNKEHVNDINKLNGTFFDIVVVNLYPFEQVLKQSKDENLLLENIDIGGHTLLRAASKNYKYIDVLSDPSQYLDFINGLTNRKDLAKNAFSKVMQYDIAINNWLNQDKMQTIGASYSKLRPMKYGLNPYMKPSDVYIKDNIEAPFEVLNGCPGYINLLDANYAIHLVLEVKKNLGNDCCASYKHNSPAGVAMDEWLFSEYPNNSKAANIFTNARQVDPKSSFGDIIGYSDVVDKKMALQLKKCVSDGIIAYNYTEEALEILKTKKKGKYLILKQQEILDGMEYRDINGVTLFQPTNNSILSRKKLKNIPFYIQSDMILGYITLKYTQSNCVCFVFKNKVIGIGSGQQNRVDCVKIAGNKAQNWMKRNNLNMLKEDNIVLISDAFFPFSDNIEKAAEYNVQYILQPGGSIRDSEVENACKKYNIKMVMSNQRVFTH